MDITEKDVTMSVDIVLTTQHVTMLPEHVLMDVNLDTKHQIVPKVLYIFFLFKNLKKKKTYACP